MSSVLQKYKKKGDHNSISVNIEDGSIIPDGQDLSYLVEIAPISLEGWITVDSFRSLPESMDPRGRRTTNSNFLLHNIIPQHVIEKIYIFASRISRADTTVVTRRMRNSNR